jgi:hypothetical protein
MMPEPIERRQHRRDRDDQHDQRHQSCGLGAGVHVADDGARDHHGRSPAERLHHAGGDQGIHVGRQRAARMEPAANKREAGNQRRLAADHVGHRAIDHLGQTVGDEIGGDGQLRTRQWCCRDLPAMVGSAGRNMSMASGPVAHNRPSTTAERTKGDIGKPHQENGGRHPRKTPGCAALISKFADRI